MENETTPITTKEEKKPRKTQNNDEKPLTNSILHIELLNALKKVQGELPVIAKSTDGFNYKYADMETVWASVHKILEKYGFVIAHRVTNSGVLTIAYHEYGELESFIPFSNSVKKPQEIGSEITYFKRYNLVSIFNMIVGGEDDDAATAQNAVTDNRSLLDKVSDTVSPDCPKCGSKMVLRSSARGDFWGCSKYPNCRGLLNTQQVDRAGATKGEDEQEITL